MKIRAAVPVRHERTAAFTMRARGCGLEDARRPVYAVSLEAKAFADLRRDLKLGLRDAAQRLEVSAREIIGLESGRLVLENEGDWTRAREALHGSERKR